MRRRAPEADHARNQPARRTDAGLLGARIIPQLPLVLVVASPPVCRRVLFHFVCRLVARSIGGSCFERGGKGREGYDGDRTLDSASLVCSLGQRDVPPRDESRRRAATGQTTTVLPDSPFLSPCICQEEKRHALFALRHTIPIIIISPHPHLVHPQPQRDPEPHRKGQQAGKNRRDTQVDGGITEYATPPSGQARSRNDCSRWSSPPAVVVGRRVAVVYFLASSRVIYNGCGIYVRACMFLQIGTSVTSSVMHAYITDLYLLSPLSGGLVLATLAVYTVDVASYEQICRR